MKLSNDIRGSATKTAAIVIVAIIVIAGVGFFAASNYGKTATVQIEVQSTHILQDVSVQVSVDGKVVKSIDKLSPLTVVTIEYKHNFGLLKESSLVSFKAISTGGMTGSITYVEDVIVFNGGNYTVKLMV